MRAIVFDLRDGSRTGIGRVAREVVAAWRRDYPADPVTVLTNGGGRYSLQAQREWPAIRRAHPDATWVWFHWDVPWFGMPRRSVVYVHDLNHYSDPNPVKRLVARAWITHALKRAGRVVTGSRAVAELLPREATVIPHGVDAAFAGEWTPQDYVLTVGEDRPNKNFALVRQLGVPHRHAWGVSDEELAALYRGARVVLVPSRVEGFGLPVIEAMAHGVPVIASDIPPLREVSGGLATLLDPDDVNGWRQAVRAVWDEPGPADARRAWAGRFTWARSAAMLRAVASELG